MWCIAVMVFLWFIIVIFAKIINRIEIWKNKLYAALLGLNNMLASIHSIATWIQLLYSFFYSCKYYLLTNNGILDKKYRI